jgi:hypothetical protein
MRQIKFRAWDLVQKEMVDWEGITSHGATMYGVLVEKHKCIPMQFIGLIDTKGKEVYEGDIYFTEAETDNGDVRELYIVVWIKEWCRFAFLHLPGEYEDYLDNGIEHFDTAMDDSYIVNVDELAMMHYKGNMYEHPQLLTYKSIYDEAD